MKVIEYGHIKPKQIKCNNCGATLEYLEQDLRLLKNGVYIVQCPVCRGMISKDNEGKELTRWVNGD